MDVVYYHSQSHNYLLAHVLTASPSRKWNVTADKICVYKLPRFYVFVNFSPHSRHIENNTYRMSNDNTMGHLLWRIMTLIFFDKVYAKYD
jgi:hypothetical protein